MKRQIGIHFGALCQPISTQLKAQGFKFKKSEVSWFQKQAEAIALLFIQDILTEKEKHKAHERLLKKITAHVAKENK